MASNAVVRECVQSIAVLLKEELKRIANNMNKGRKKRRFWVRQWILRRNRLGASETLLKELALEDKEGYRNQLRMSEEKLEELLSKVQDVIKKQDTVMRQAISPRLKLQVTLRYLATGDSFATLASVYRVPKNTISNFLGEVCTAIYDTLQDFIKVSINILQQK
ncbi:uncharacterized protein LOC111692397 [Anoplophora glabripennis]|uniref:uncharacterized protein LOC111692397 n=1 Tax=Anoplophora glabripennis TaxID=217634 RepID=UPI000C76B4BB|nr:uncharacterized protein LOC111692397 [Anoplophora glabripennis]